MKTIMHPAYIEDYKKEYTDKLKESPNGTYAIIYTDKNAGNYLLVVSMNGKALGLPYSEVGNDISLSNNPFGFGLYKNQSVDTLFGDGVNTFKTVNIMNVGPVSLTGTLKSLLNLSENENKSTPTFSMSND